MRLVGLEGALIGEGDQGDEGTTSEFLAFEFMDAVAHGDGVCGTRESMDMTMKDGDDGVTPLLGEPPRGAVAVDEGELGSEITDGGAACAHRVRVYGHEYPDI